MGKKIISVLLICGGPSEEHDVSLRSAAFVASNLPKDRFCVIPVRIDRTGEWWLDESILSRDGREPGKLTRVFLPVGRIDSNHLRDEDGSIVAQFDVVFPIAHGTFGEDGKLQGVLETIGVPYVGSDVLGSAVGMDKGIQKFLLRANGIPVTDFVSFTRHEWAVNDSGILKKIRQLGSDIFVKPVDSGSSVGISHVRKFAGVVEAINEALNHSEGVIVEKTVLNARELECAVLQKKDKFWMAVGEIKSGVDFYDYQAKYVTDTARAIVPANITKSLEKKIIAYSKTAFEVLHALDFSRIDFLLDETTGNLFMSEINTLPGMTETSLYPRLMRAAGLPKGRMLAMLVDNALARHRKFGKV